MSRRSPRLAALRASTEETTVSLQVIKYYYNVLETLNDSQERISAAISCFEFIFQNWPILKWNTSEQMNKIQSIMQNIRNGLPEMHDISISSKIRLSILFESLESLMKDKNSS